MVLKDGLHKQSVMKTTLDDKLAFGNECLENALTVLTNGKLVKEYQEDMTVEFMQCISSIRFGMCFAARMFCEYYCNFDEMEKLPKVTKEQGLEKLRATVQNVVKEGVMKEPQDFLIKQIVRQYGFPYLDSLSGMAEFEWLAPKSKVSRNIHQASYKGKLKYLF